MSRSRFNVLLTKIWDMGEKYNKKNPNTFTGMLMWGYTLVMLSIVGFGSVIIFPIVTFWIICRYGALAGTIPCFCTIYFMWWIGIYDVDGPKKGAPEE